MWGTKLPNKAGGRYLITLKTGVGLQVRQAEFVEYPKGNFRWMVLPSCEQYTSEVLAWMKEPKPYVKK